MRNLLISSFLIGWLLGGSPCSAEFIFNIVPSQSTYITDGINPVSGSFAVVLNLTNGSSASNVASFNFQYTAPTALGVTSVTNVGTGVNGGLMDGIVTNSSTFPTVLTYAKTTAGGTFTAFDGAILARFNFTTTTPTAADYAIGVGNIAFQQLADDNADPITPLIVNGGVMHITAVPEPGSLCLVGIAIWGGACLRRRLEPDRKEKETV